MNEEQVGGVTSQILTQRIGELTVEAAQWQARALIAEQALAEAQGDSTSGPIE